LCQTRKADEIVVIDDASADGTANILQTPEFKGRINLFYNEKATGFVDAWNRVIQRATGDFVTILHQDDLLHPEYLAHIEAALGNFPQVRHFYTAYNYIDEQGKITGASPKPHLPAPVLYTGKEYAHAYLQGVIANRHIHRCPGVTTNRALLLSECSYRKEAGHIADDDFFLRVGAFTDVVGISYPLASFRHHPASATSRVDSLSLKLAEAYLFQVRYYRPPAPHLSAGDINGINSLAVRFINLLLYEGLIQGRRDWVIKAFALHEELEELLPSFMNSHLPAWGKMIWAMASPQGDNLLAKSCAKSLHGCIGARDWLKANL
jgi:Glycosyltransferases involved in cell wall biogenesis